MTEDNKKRRIAIVGPLFPYRGGIAHYTAMLARELGTDNTLLLINYCRLYPRIFFPGKTEFDNSAYVFSEKAHQLIDMLNPITWLRAIFRIRRFCPDAVIIQWWQPFFMPMVLTISLFLKLWQIPVILICHNVVSHEGCFIDRFLSNRAFAGASGLVVHARHDAEELGHRYPNKKVIQADHPVYDMFPRGPETKEELKRQLSFPDGTRIILFFGLIRAYKGLGVLLEAMKRLSDPTVHCLIVGENYEAREKYGLLIQSLGIGANVRIIDEYIPNEDVYRYFTVADVLVLPYLSASQSGVAQIAWSFSCPIIATTVGGLPDLFSAPGSGILVPPGSTEGLVNAIRQALEPEIAAKIKQTMNKELHRFSWHVLGQKLEQLIMQLNTQRKRNTIHGTDNGHQ